MGEKLTIGVTRDRCYSFPLSWLESHGFEAGDIVEFIGVVDDGRDMLLVKKQKKNRFSLV